MNCGTLTNDVLVDLSEQRLDEGRRATVEAHLLDCADCRRRFDEIRAIAGAIQRCAETPPEPLLRDLDAAVLSMIARPRRRPVRWIAGLATAAAALTIGLVGYFRWDRPHLPPPPPASHRPPRVVPSPKLGNCQPMLGDAPIANTRPEALPRATLDVSSLSRAFVPPRPRGDVNGDWIVNVADRLILSRHLTSGAPLSDARAADLNSDGVVDVADVQLLTREIARAR